jgi:hypothetical protein
MLNEFHFLESFVTEQQQKIGVACILIKPMLCLNH